MLFTKEILKKVVIYGAIAAALFVGYSVFFKSDEDAGTLTAVFEESMAGTPPAALELLRLLDDLKNITLDTDIFKDEAYTALRDWSVTLTPEPRGRTNPFAPL